MSKWSMNSILTVPSRNPTSHSGRSGGLIRHDHRDGFPGFPVQDADPLAGADRRKHLGKLCFQFGNRKRDHVKNMLTDSAATGAGMSIVPDTGRPLAVDIFRPVRLTAVSATVRSLPPTGAPPGNPDRLLDPVDAPPSHRSQVSPGAGGSPVPRTGSGPARRPGNAPSSRRCGAPGHPPPLWPARRHRCGASSP